ncbi:MAG: hypothetical protein AVDCRST_MAG41-3158, partial [uncultured Corynebacteriales bacterium]
WTTDACAHPSGRGSISTTRRPDPRSTACPPTSTVPRWRPSWPTAVRHCAATPPTTGSPCWRAARPGPAACAGT